VQMLVDGLTPFVFSHRTTQYFCPNCGCHMLARTLRGDQDEVSASRLSCCAVANLVML
jgi:hypothetical protein